MANNELKITEKNGYKNIDIQKMDDGDTIVITKKYAEAKKYEGEKDYNDGKGPRKWVLYSCGGTYNGEEVSFVLKKYHSINDTIVEAEELVEKYNAAGGIDDNVRITCKKTMGKAAYDFKPKFAKEDDIIKMDFTFEKVE